MYYIYNIQGMRVNFSCRQCLKWAKEDDGGILCACPYLLNYYRILPFFLPSKYMHAYLWNIHSFTCQTCSHVCMCKAPPRPDTHNCTSNSVVASKSRRVFVAWSSLDFRLYPVMPPTLQALCNSESRNKILAREKEALALKH